MRAAVIIFPGSNCDRDAAVCCAHYSGVRPFLVWHEERSLPKADVIILPGGFSYGDYLRAGAFAAHSPVVEAVRRAAKAGVPVLGICNGFQILTEAGLLPGALIGNASTLFVCRPVYLRVEAKKSPFTSAYDSSRPAIMPVAHHAGNYQADDESLRRLEGEGRIAFRYCDEAGALTQEANPNGSAANIAGIYNAAGNVLGLMPHPERAARPHFHFTGGEPLFTGIANL